MCVCPFSSNAGTGREDLPADRRGVAIVIVKNRWTLHAMLLLGGGLFAQLLIAYAVGLWGASMGASKWLVSSMASQVSLLDDASTDELHATAAMMAMTLEPQAGDQGQDLQERLRLLGDANPGRIVGWTSDVREPWTNEPRCLEALRENEPGASSYRFVLHCEHTAVIAVRPAARPELVVGYALDDAFARRIHRLTNAEAIVYVGDRLVTEQPRRR